RDLAGFAAALPRHVRFVSAFGAQALPECAASQATATPLPFDRPRLTREFGIEADVLARVVPPEDYATASDWIDATQAHQADVVKHVVETLRRLKYRPTGGFSVYRLRDVTRHGGFGLL